MFTLMPYRKNTLNLFDELARDFDRSFLNRPSTCGTDVQCSTHAASWTPAVDIKEEENRYLVSADLPGIDPKDIEITLEGGVLSISGERSAEKEDEHEGYKRVERVYGSFRRQFSLPESVDAEGIKAKGKNGVLEIQIPKVEKSKPKRITVQ